MIALILAGFINQGSPEAAANEYKALQARLAEIHSIEGDLTTWKGGKTSGQVHFEIKRPNLFRVETIWPGEGSQLSIGDGKHCWYYSLPEKTYIEKDAQPDRTRIGSLFGFEQFDSPDEIYYNFKGMTQEDFRGKPAESIELYFPNNPNSTMKLYVDLKTRLPLGFRYTTGKAAGADFVYSSLNVNPPTKPSDFVFRLPTDAKPFAMPQFDLRSKLVAVGTVAPDFTLSTPSGKQLKLSDFEKSNRLVLLDFWFRDCEPCKMELAHLSHNYASLKKEGVELLAVDCGDTVETVKDFVAKQRYRFPIAMDRAEKSINGIYGVQAFPTTYVIGPDGKIIASSVGFDEKELSQTLSKALQSSKPAPPQP